MEQVVVAVPQGIPLRLVGLKQHVIEKKHSVTFKLDQVACEIELTGTSSQINDAREELLAVFSRMKPSSSFQAAPATGVASPPARQATSRYMAAKDAREHSWEFVGAGLPESDTRYDAFSYELLRRQRQQVQTSPLQTKSFEFMLNFDNRFVQTMANVVDKRVGMNDDVKVDASFGRKLFQLIDVEPNREYTWDELRVKNAYTAVKTSWTNVLDTDAPGMTELLADLCLRAAELGIHGPKEKLSVWVKEGRRKQGAEHHIKYARRDGVWERKKPSKIPVPHTIHDIILANRVSMRIWVSSKRATVGDDWDAVANSVVIHEGAGGNIFGTKVTLTDTGLGGDVESQDTRIKWISVKSQLEIPFANLRFKLAQAENGVVMLEVALPKRPGFQPTPGGKFALLAKRVEAVFQRYADGKSNSEEVSRSKNV